jgi:hypothetical protein
MSVLPIIVPVFIGIVCLLLLGQMIRAGAEWVRNNNMPVESVPARVVAKRTETWGGGGHHSHRRVSTNYFVTFELKSGDRMEFNLYGKDYGLLVEGDEGTLTYQGTRYHGFDRRPLA